MYKILIGDDHALILDGLRDLLLKMPEVSHVDIAHSKAGLLAAAAAFYDIVFLDIHFGEHDGRDIARELKQNFPEIILVALTGFDDKDTIRSTVNAGFNAFFLKSDDPDEISEWLKSGAFNHVYLSRKTQNVYTQHTLLKDKGAKSHIRLSNREKEVLRHILAEKTTRQIAEKMFLSEKTIENYRSNLMYKLDVTNLAGLVKKSILLGLSD